MSYQVLSPQEWAKREFGSVQLKDQRLTRRVVKVAEAMAADPGGSIPKQNKQSGQSKGAYRLFDHQRATFQSLSHPHWQQTRMACGESAVVLLLQDTTWLDYSDHRATEGLGWHNRSRKNDGGGSGLYLHSVLAVEPQEDGRARILGLGWAKLYARRGQPQRGDPSKRSRRRRSPERESRRWIEAVKQIGEPGPLSRWIHVGDRESDLYDLYEQTRQMKQVGFVIRLSQDRNAAAGHDTPDTCKIADRQGSSLKDLCRGLARLGSKQVWIRPQGGRAGRWAKLSVCGGAVTLWSPRLNRTGRALRCWALRAWEDNPPEATEPIEWMLLSSEPIREESEALRVLDWYSCRWLIEEYHQCLKSGCKVQQRQLETAERLEPLIGMFTLLAVRLLQLKNDARLTPDRPAVQCVPPEMVQTLARLIKADDPATMTVRRFTHEVAKRGGFMGRKGDGEPGWLTLWRGWQELSLIHAGYLLASEQIRCG